MNDLDTDMDMDAEEPGAAAETPDDVPDVPGNLLTWDDLTEADQSNAEFLQELLKKYKSRLRSIKDEPSRNRITMMMKVFESKINKLKVAARIQLSEKQAELDKIKKDDKEDKLVEYYRKFLNEHEIYYVATANMYMEYFPDTGKWDDMQREAVQTHYSIRGKGVWDAFQGAMSELGRKKVTIECSFYPKPARVLNLMRKDHWLKPSDGEPHYGFKLLLMSLGNGKQENIDHIEQVVYWKYTHPDEFRLPCLVIYGEGGAGKNTFVKELLGTIFGYHQVLVADAEKTLGNFNGLIQGKTVVMIDEAVADKINSDRLKRTVGNKTIDINPKYGKQGEHDNTPLYFAGGNDTTGAILLAGDATDRRWSILKVDKSIIQRLADDKGISFDAALKEYDKIKSIFTNRQEVAVWLHYLVERWKHLEHAPVGLHQEDYKQLLETQKSPFEDLMDAIFNRPDFTHIEGQVLYDIYKQFLKESNPSARGPAQRNKFYAQVREWHLRNKTGIEWGKIKISGRGSSTEVTTGLAFYRDKGTKVFADNRDDYLPQKTEQYTYSEAKPPFWNRPPVEPRLRVANPVEVALGEDPKLVEVGEAAPAAEEGEAAPAPKKRRFSSV